MRLLYPAVVAALGVFLLAAPGSAAPAEGLSATDLSSQLRIEEGRRGVRVDVDGPGRFERRGFERRGFERRGFERRGFERRPWERRRFMERERFGGRGCAVRSVTEFVNGRRITRTVRRCG